MGVDGFTDGWMDLQMDDLKACIFSQQSSPSVKAE